MKWLWLENPLGATIGVLPGAAASCCSSGVLASLGPVRRGLPIDSTEALRRD